MAKLLTGFAVTSSRCKAIVAIGVLLLGLIVYTSPALSGGRSDDPLGVAVSPQTFILGVEQGSVSVHTNLPLSAVDRSKSVTLNGIEAIYLKADACGNLVAKFDELEIEAILSPPSEVMTLVGTRKDGTVFSGSDSVRVVEDQTP